MAGPPGFPDFGPPPMPDFDHDVDPRPPVQWPGRAGGAQFGQRGADLDGDGVPDFLARVRGHRGGLFGPRAGQHQPGTVTGDFNRDGRPDYWVVDGDRDGRTDSWRWDIDGDGRVDIIATDTDDDPRPDHWYYPQQNRHAWDTDSDGRADLWATDADRDGRFEYWQRDVDKDGSPDVSTIDRPRVAGIPQAQDNPWHWSAALRNEQPDLPVRTSLRDRLENKLDSLLQRLDCWLDRDDEMQVSGPISKEPTVTLPPLRKPTLAPAPPPTTQPAGSRVAIQPSPSHKYFFPVLGGIARFSDTWGAQRSGGRGHRGVDLNAVEGTPVVAVCDGTITRVYTRKGAGLSVRLNGADGNGYEYMHLKEVPDRLDSKDPTYKGERRSIRVKAGEVIGYVGRSGFREGSSTPAHLHFQAFPDHRFLINRTKGIDRRVDPYPLLEHIAGLRSPDTPARRRGDFIPFGDHEVRVRRR